MALNIEDLGIVQEELFSIRAKAYNVGLMLKVPVGTLDSIGSQFADPSDKLRETLKAWLKTAVQQKWQTIVEALRTNTVSEPKLASDVEAKYCQGTPGQESGQRKYTHVLIQNVQQQVQASHESQQRVQQQLTELTLQLQSTTQSREHLVCELQEQHRAIEAQQELKQLQSVKQLSTQPQPNFPQQEMTLRKLIWWYCPKALAPQAMMRGSVATDGITVYCSSFRSTSVYQYHNDTQQWSILPDLPHIYSTLVIANGNLTSVGGFLGPGEATDILLSLTGKDRDRKWLQHFPRMITKRYLTAAICHGHSLIVAGGMYGHNVLTTVEVLNMNTRLWSIASSLPHSFFDATTSICGERLYLLGGDYESRGTCSVLTCSISELLHSCQTRVRRQSTIWKHVADTPYKASSCATLCGQLVAVGGYGKAGKVTTAIFIYNESTNTWLFVEAMKTPRCWALVSSLHDNTMMVVGGLGCDTVEIAKFS